MLMLDYICKRRIALGKMPKNPVMVKTIVTIELARRIAEDYGVQVIDVLTGFKFIGEQIGLLEKKGRGRPLHHWIRGKLRLSDRQLCPR